MDTYMDDILGSLWRARGIHCHPRVPGEYSDEDKNSRSSSETQDC